MKTLKLLSTLSSSVLVGSTATTFATKLTINHKNSNNPFSNLKLKSRQGNNIKLGSGFSNTNHHNYKSDSAQEIINKIINKHFSVPSDTNPDVSNTQTIKTIKSYLQKNNSGLTDADLNYIQFVPLTPGQKLNTATETNLLLLAKVGSNTATTYIYVKLAAQASPAINLFNPLITPNNYSAAINAYYDDVFLKTLAWNDSQHAQVISNKNKLSDPQDIADYKKMIANPVAIKKCLLILNRYLRNGFLKFDPNGNIPKRNQLLTLPATTSKQTVITTSIPTSDVGIGFSIGDYLSFDMHWDHINVNLKPAFVGSIIKAFINAQIDKVVPPGKFLKYETFGSKFTDLKTRLIASMAAGALEFIDHLNELIEITCGGNEEFAVILTVILDVISATIAGQIIAAVINIMPSLCDYIDKWCGNDVSNFPYNNYTNPYDPKKDDKLLFNFSKSSNQVIAMGININIDYFLPMFSPHLFSFYIAKTNLKIPTPLNPSKFSPSLNTASSITGKGGPSSDFTLCLSSPNWETFKDVYQDPTSTIARLFNSVDLNKNKEQYFTKADFQAIINGATHFAGLDTNNFAVFHVVNRKVVWTNLDSNKAANALKLSNNGESSTLTASFINENNNTNVLINQNIYLKIENVFVYAYENWKYLKLHVPEISWQQYAVDYSFKQSSINTYNLNTTALVTVMTNLASNFSFNIDTSHLNQNLSPIMNIYCNNFAFPVQI